MANVFEGLFQTPEEVVQAQRQSLLGTAVSKSEKRGMLMGMSLGSAFGLKTGAEKQAEQTQGILKNVDTNNPDSIAAGIEAAKSAGLLKVSSFLEGKAYELTQKNRETEQWKRTTTVWGQQDEDRLRNINRQSVLDARDTWSFEQQQLAAARDEQALTLGNQVMTEIGFNPKNPDMVGYYGAMVKKAEEAGRSDLAMQYAVKLDEYKVKQASKLNENMGVISAKDYTAAGAAELTGLRQQIASLPLGPERTQLTKEMQQRQNYWAEEASKGKIEEARRTAEEIADAEASVATREKALEALEQEQIAVADNMSFVKQLGKIVEQANKGEIYVGFGAEAKLEISKFAEAIGIDNEEWKGKAANTEQAMTLLSEKILEKIKQLGANPSNADREFLAKTLPMVTTSPEGLGKIYEYMRLRALGARETVKQKQEYVQRNNNLRGFESTATVELAEFLKKEGIDAIKLRANNSSAPDFSEQAMKQFQSGAVVDSYQGITTLAYPTRRITAAQVDDMFKGNVEFSKGDIDSKITLVADRYRQLKEVAQDREISEEVRANLVEELKALEIRARQLIQEAQANER